MTKRNQVGLTTVAFDRIITSSMSHVFDELLVKYGYEYKLDKNALIVRNLCMTLYDTIKEQDLTYE